MRRRTSVVMATLLGVCLLLSGFCAVRMLSARRHADDARIHLSQVADSVKALRHLQEITKSGATGKRPAPGLTGQVADAMAQAGIPLAAMSSLTPEPETELSRTGDIARMRQGARLALEAVTLPQLGQFLQAWRTQHPEWTILSLQLTPLPGRQSQSAGATPEPLRINMVMECQYTEFGDVDS